MEITSLFPLGYMHYLLGGILIGLATSLMFIFTGKVVGMSSVFSSSLTWVSKLSYFQQARLIESRVWRLYLALGLVVGAALYWFGFGPATAWQTQVEWWQLAIGGFIAGFGARMSNGCTSGHGICGMASLQLPSIFAVVVFLSVAFVFARLVTLIGGL